MTGTDQQAPRAPRADRPGWNARTRREAVVQEAARLFAELGYHRASFGRIAQAAGVSQPFIVKRWLTKEALLLEICERHIDGLLLAMEQVPPEAPLPRLEAMAVALADAVAADRTAARTLPQSGVALGATPLRDLKARQRWLLAIFIEALEATLPKLARRPDLATPAALSLLSLLTSHDLWFREAGPMSRPDYARFAVRSIVAGLRGTIGRRAASDPADPGKRRCRT